MTLILLLPLALADIPSGPEDCVIDNYDAEQCVVCSDSFEDGDACEAEYGDTRELACRSNGASVWDEVWCEPGATEPSRSGGCAVSPTAPAGLAAFGLGLAGLLARRRA